MASSTASRVFDSEIHCTERRSAFRAAFHLSQFALEAGIQSEFSDHLLRVKQTPVRRATVTVYLPSWRCPGSGDGVMRIKRLSSENACSVLVYRIPVLAVPKSKLTSKFSSASLFSIITATCQLGSVALSNVASTRKHWSCEVT